MWGRGITCGGSRHRPLHQKKRATVEIADDAEDRTAQQEWNLLIHELSGSS